MLAIARLSRGSPQMRLWSRPAALIVATKIALRRAKLPEACAFGHSGTVSVVIATINTMY